MSMMHFLELRISKIQFQLLKNSLIFSKRAFFRFSVEKMVSKPSEWLDTNPDDSQTILEESKLLGILWNAKTDILAFSSNPESIDQSITKRRVLSPMARLYDPLRLLSPILCQFKVFMQLLWVKELSWDETLPENLASQWRTLYHELISVNSLKIPRWLGTLPTSRIEIHGFGDASKNAMCASAYFRIFSDNGSQMNLVVAKTKVAPLKMQSIPRLDLYAALLLCQLVNSLLENFDLSEVNIHLWSDSKVVLCWTASQPYLWQTFVSHRVAEIQRLVHKAHWNYIETKQNSTDIATRKISINGFKVVPAPSLLKN